ncbi:MAG TPA: hypothetical protein DCM07_09050, partial [Planctomycetaceae bacterium]|nr:hypothetical protein [Planctomycetaceae bacterium]
MIKFYQRRSSLICLQTAVMLCGISVLPAAEKPTDKTENSQLPLQAVKPILNHGPTSLPAALPFAELDADKAARMTAAQEKAVNQLTAELKQVEAEINQLQTELKEAKQKIKSETEALNTIQQNLKESQNKKPEDPQNKDQADDSAEAVKLKAETLSRELNTLEQQVKQREQSLTEKQKQQAELKKQAAAAEKQLTEQRAKANQFQEFVKLFRDQQPTADPERFREVAAFSHSRPLYSCKIDASGNYL